MLADRNDLGFFFWIPANLTVYGFSQEARMIRELQVRFDAERLIPILGGEIFGGKLHMPTPSIYDDRVAKCASMLADCCIDWQNEDRLFGECLITSLLAAAVQNITGKVSGSQVSGLVPWQLRIAKEYLHEHLVGEVSLEEVAGLTKLSLSRFARGFKASTGLPPLQMVAEGAHPKGASLDGCNGNSHRGYRFRLAAEHARTALVFLTQLPCASSCATLSLRCEPAAVVPFSSQGETPLFERQQYQFARERNRNEGSPFLQRKPAQRVSWSAETLWSRVR
jgi:AraC-like DNA-binding protein